MRFFVFANDRQLFSKDFWKCDMRKERVLKPQEVEN